MKIIDVLIDEIQEYENNPRNNDSAVEVVAASIKEYGFKVPIVIDKDGVIIAGHTRLKAARSLGLTSVPCVVADDLTPEQVTAFRIVDNKTAELAGWEHTKLDEELRELKDLGEEMERFGFRELEEVDINELFSEPEEEKKKEPKTIKCEHCGELFEV